MAHRGSKQAILHDMLAWWNSFEEPLVRRLDLESKMLSKAYSDLRRVDSSRTEWWAAIQDISIKLRQVHNRVILLQEGGIMGLMRICDLSLVPDTEWQDPREVLEAIREFATETLHSQTDAITNALEDAQHLLQRLTNPSS